MKALKIAMKLSLTVAICVLFIQCGKSMHNKDLFFGTWREVRHGDGYDFDDRYAITMTLNKDNTFALYIPWRRFKFSGTWTIADVDTTMLLVLKNNIDINNRADYDAFQKDYYNQDYQRYYFFKINKAEKGKLYLTDATTRRSYDASKEHLFKPQE